VASRPQLTGNRDTDVIYQDKEDNVRKQSSRWTVRDVITTVLLSVVMIVIQAALNVIFMFNNFASMVLSTGVIVLLVLTGLREAIFRAVPRYLRTAIAPERHYVQGVLWHRKALYLRIHDPRPASLPLAFTIGIRHMAQWGGTSTLPKMGRQPQSLKDFARIILGQSGGSDATVSDQINVLGNHYGTFDFRLDYAGPRFVISAYYQHFWEDRSGIEWYNGLDGLAGISIDLPPFPHVRRIVVEHLSTMDQSGPFHFIQYDHKKYPGYGGGADNYYNNGEYTTGASYFGRALGSPLLLSPAYNANRSPAFLHNRIRAWHIGAEGRIAGSWGWRARLSTLRSYGTPYAPTLRPLDNTSLSLDIRYLLPDAHSAAPSGWEFTATLALDRGSLIGPRTGVGLTVSRCGWIRWAGR